MTDETPEKIDQSLEPDEVNPDLGDLAGDADAPDPNSDPDILDGYGADAPEPDAGTDEVQPDQGDLPDSVETDDPNYDWNEEPAPGSENWESTAPVTPIRDANGGFLPEDEDGDAESNEQGDIITDDDPIPDEDVWNAIPDEPTGFPAPLPDEGDEDYQAATSEEEDFDTTAEEGGEAAAAGDLVLDKLEIQAKQADSDVWNTITVVDADTDSIDLPGLPPSEKWQFRIRDIYTDGTFSNWSAPVDVDVPADLISPPAPSTPQVEGSVGYATVKWDGLDYQGNAMPPDFAFLVIWHSPSGDPGTWTRHTSMTGAGSSTFTDLTLGVPHYFVFTALDFTGNESDMSTMVEVVARKLVDDDSLREELDASAAELEAAQGDIAAVSTDVAQAKSDAADAQSAASAAASQVTNVNADLQTAKGNITKAQADATTALTSIGKVQADMLLVSDGTNYATFDPASGAVGDSAQVVTRDGTSYLATVSGQANYVYLRQRTDGMPFRANDVLSFEFDAIADSSWTGAARMWSYPNAASGSASGSVAVASPNFTVGTTLQHYVLQVPVTSAWVTGKKSYRLGLNGTDAYSKNLNVKNVSVRRVSDATLIQDGAITTDKLTANAVTADKITSSAITSDKIATNAVTSDKVLANAITAGKINADAVTGREIKALSITGDHIQANTIDTAQLKSGAVTSDIIKSGSITSGDLAADAITGKTITGGTITGSYIRGTTIDGANITGDGLTVSKSGSVISLRDGQIRFNTKLSGAPAGQGVLYATNGDTAYTYFNGASGSVNKDIARIEMDSGKWTAADAIDRPELELEAGYVNFYRVSEVRLTPDDPDDDVTFGGRGTGSGKTIYQARGTARLTSQLGYGRVDCYDNGAIWMVAGKVGGGRIHLALADGDTQYNMPANGGHEWYTWGDKVLSIGSNLGNTNGRLVSPPTFNYASGSSPNVGVTSYGTFYRNSSLRKYKLDIEDIPREQIDALLNVKPRRWHDKGETDRRNEWLAAVEEAKAKGEEPPSPEAFDCPTNEPEWIPGVIADEIEDAGADGFLTRDFDGEVNGVYYDRIGAALLAVVREQRDQLAEHEQRITDLESKLDTLTSRLEALEARLSA